MIGSTSATQMEFIFYNMVGVEFNRLVTFQEMQESVSLAVMIQEATGRDDGHFFIRYAERLKAIRNMTFDWQEDVPEAFKALQKWWDMLSTTDAVECYLYYVGNVAMQITHELGEAFDKARKIWKPSEQRQTPQSEESKTDPNS